MTLSPSGKSVMAVVESSGSKLIIKNGEIVGTLGEGYITGSYRSNGSHSIALMEKNGLKHILYDGNVVGRDLEEIRETFLEKDSGSYAYFGRPL